MNRKLEILTPKGLEDGGKQKRMVLRKRTSCIGCGDCCKGGGPVLLKADLPLFLSGALSYNSVYTIREGEPLMSRGDGEVFESSLELIKIRGKEGAVPCMFFGEGKGCSIYENRPSQCRTYECWASGGASEGLEREAMSRKEIFGEVDLLVEVMDRHQEKCPYNKLSAAFEKLAGGDDNAAEEIIDMLQYDAYARPFLAEKFNIPIDAMDLILGRPLADAIRAYGFKLEREGDEYILLPDSKESEKIEEEK